MEERVLQRLTFSLQKNQQMNELIEWIKEYGEYYRKPITNPDKYEPIRRDGGKYGWYVKLVPPPPPVEILFFPNLTDSEIIARQLIRNIR